MKKSKLLSFVLLILSVLFIGKNVVEAKFPDSIGPIYQSGDVVSYNGEDYLALKYYDSIPVFCTEFKKTEPSGRNISCTITDDWNTKIRVGVAAIIKKAGSISIGGDASRNYYYGELAVNQFLCANGFTESCVSTSRTTSQILGDYMYLYDAGVSAKNNYSSLNLSLSNNTLTFTKDANGDYKSNEITVTTNASNYTVTTDVGTVTKNDKKFYVIVPAKSVGYDKTLNVNVTVEANQSTAVARNYSCGSSYQTITPMLTEPLSETKKITAKGTIEGDTEQNLQLIKLDEKGKGIEGSIFRLQTEKEKEEGKSGVEYKPGTTGVKIDVKNLEPGTYYLIEYKAPKGYARYTKYIKVIKDSKGKINIEYDQKDKDIIEVKGDQTIQLKIKNARTQTKFSKISIVNQKELPGASLKILDENKKVLLDEKGNAYEWVSGEEPYYIYGLPAGKYYLQETLAPEGYALSEEMVEFEVKDDGSVTEVVMENALEVSVPDTLSNKSALLVFIGMLDIALGIGILLYVKRNKFIGQ